MKNISRRVIILLVPLLLGGCVTMQPKEKAAEKAPVVDDATYTRNAITRAEEAINQGKTTAAIFHYSTALQKSPENGTALRGLGNIYLGKNQPEIAGRYFHEGVRLDANDAASQEGLGLAMLRQLQYLQAEEHLKLAVQLDKTLWRAWNGLGVAADFKSEHADAVAYYHQALKIVPGAPGIINNHGYSLLMEKKYPESEQQFRRGLQIAPDHQRLRNNLGITLAWQRRYDDGIKEIEHILPAAAALNNVGYIAMQLGDYELAAGYFEQALKVSPTYYLPAAKNLRRLQSMK
ncbi:MAG: tetratricopeptide repeat protein [Candidatus Sedimenticola sp. (ex Thyasira tokunagai)]